jgi:hypothetical protein
LAQENIKESTLSVLRVRGKKLNLEKKNQSYVKDFVRQFLLIARTFILL